MERLDYVDVFRGIAILVMIFFHFIHVLAPVNVYSDFPYFLADLGILLLPPPPFLFLFVAGMSAYLLVTKRKQAGWERGQILQNVVVKYGRYVLISLPFTWFVFDLATWLAWEEALQGIGMTIILLAAIYAVIDIGIVSGLALILGFTALQANRALIGAMIAGIAAVPPVFEPVTGFTYNMVFGGYFSLTNLLPFAIGGLLTIKLLYERENVRTVLGIGAALTVTALILSTQGFSLRFYARDIPIGLFGAGGSMLFYGVLYLVHARHPRHAFFEVLARFGRYAFLVYIWTWILVIKGISLAGLEGTIPHAASWGVSAAIVAGTVLATLRYDQYRQANGPLILQVKRSVDAMR